MLFEQLLPKINILQSSKCLLRPLKPRYWNKSWSLGHWLGSSWPPGDVRAIPFSNLIHNFPGLITVWGDLWRFTRIIIVLTDPEPSARWLSTFFFHLGAFQSLRRTCRPIIHLLDPLTHAPRNLFQLGRHLWKLRFINSTESASSVTSTPPLFFAND